MNTRLHWLEMHKIGCAYRHSGGRDACTCSALGALGAPSQNPVLGAPNVPSQNLITEENRFRQVAEQRIRDLIRCNDDLVEATCPMSIVTDEMLLGVKGALEWVLTEILEVSKL